MTLAKRMFSRIDSGTRSLHNSDEIPAAVGCGEQETQLAASRSLSHNGANDAPMALGTILHRRRHPEAQSGRCLTG